MIKKILHNLKKILIYRKLMIKKLLYNLKKIRYKMILKNKIYKIQIMKINQ